MLKRQCNDDCNKCKNFVRSKKAGGCLLEYIKVYYVSKKDN
ncbi:hypothetical protein ACEE21_14975 [Clostridium baratii]